MKFSTRVSLIFLFAFGAQIARSETRSVFLNGVDISSTKNQSMQQVNISIDSQGNVYIEAPHYEAQQESTFVPLGRQGSVTARIPQHRAPGPLPTATTPAQQALAPEGDSRDTLESAPARSGSADGFGAKEGVRIPPNGTKPTDAGGQPQQNPGKDSVAP
ncbi:MAG: hypothetical protein EOP10_00255 [Proteobacteria bacterium]|nr:MAG: hypothetical protein EOP10_00255 [Pseudomonadota bacterium]